MIKSLTIAAAIIALLYVNAAVGLYVFQRRLIFLADRTVSQPAEIGLRNTEVHRLVTSDGVAIDTWLTKTDGRKLVIYFHGNGGSLAYRAQTIDYLRQIGLSVLAVEYRGFGASEGSPSEAGLTRDADAAYDYARQLGYAPPDILLFGESLGSGVAVPLATRRDVGGLILDSAYSSIADVAADRYWMFPVRLLIRDTFDSTNFIARIKAPILMLHGTADAVVPYKFGRKLFASADKNATFETFDGVGHLSLGQSDSDERVKRWLDRLPD